MGCEAVFLVRRVSRKKRGKGEMGGGGRIEPSSKSLGFSNIVSPSLTDLTTNSVCLQN